MTYPTVAVNGVSVRVDDDGRYNLNDLHAAAVSNGEATESQRPSNFIKSAQIRRFADELTEATKIASTRVVKGGTESGVWGLELLAIRYAAWLSPKFEIRVYNTFREAVLSGITNMSRLNRLDLLIANEVKEVSACARAMNKWGVGGRKKLLNCARERIVSQMDPDMVTLMEAKAG